MWCTVKIQQFKTFICSRHLPCISQSNWQLNICCLLLFSCCFLQSGNLTGCSVFSHFLKVAAWRQIGKMVFKWSCSGSLEGRGHFSSNHQELDGEQVTKLLLSFLSLFPFLWLILFIYYIYMVFIGGLCVHAVLDGSVFLLSPQISFFLSNILILTYPKYTSCTLPLNRPISLFCCC